MMGKKMHRCGKSKAISNEEWRRLVSSDRGEQLNEQPVDAQHFRIPISMELKGLCVEDKKIGKNTDDSRM